MKLNGNMKAIEFDENELTSKIAWYFKSHEGTEKEHLKPRALLN